MSSLTEALIVGVIVLVAGLWAVRAIWRSVRGGKACSSCSSSSDCPLIAQQEKLIDLGTIDQCGPKAFDCESHRKKSDKA